MEAIRFSLVVMLCLGLQRSPAEILQRQKRNWIIDSFSIDEGYKGDFPYSLGTIDVEKDLTLFKIQGQGVDKEPKGVLEINEVTGEITVHRPVDYEKYHVLNLVFQALDRDQHIIDTQLGIEIQVIDSNDNPPKFDLERYEISIRESTVQGTNLITIKASDADATEDNRIFDFKIVSVTPTEHDLEFYLNQIKGTQTGTISFKGCLDHERAEKYMIIVEAKDRGQDIQLSSSCTVIINIDDGNNHLPEITGQTGPGRVKEREENVLVSRLQVTDQDTEGTPAWRAKYQIQGDTNNNFRITTDPETNEGLLFVEKHLDYEESSVKNVTISVENEIPYSSCKVVSSTATGLWEVVIIGGAAAGGVTGGEKLGVSTHRVTVTVEDVNEPPIFDKSRKQVTLSENVEAGQYLEMFTARDPDINSANTFRYMKGDDPADWVTVDPVTGKITTTKAIDRESPFVKDNIYQVTIYAVDDGKPPMTGTATLNIHVNDENDNAPTLNVSSIDMCQSDGPSVANITALDMDEEPYGGPFYFKLLGDVEGKWRIEPHQGYSVSLVKESTVHSGHFKLLLEVSDRQDNAAVHNLSVTVCNCLDTTRPNCRVRKATGSAAGAGAFAAIFFSMLLLAGVALLVFLVSCKKQSLKIPDEDSGQHLMKCNSETPGTDCQVAFEALNPGHSQNVTQITTSPLSQVPSTTLKKSTTQTAAVSHSEHAIHQTEQQQRNYLNWMIADSVNEDLSQPKSFMTQDFTRGNSMRWSMGASSTMRARHQEGNSVHGSMGASSTMSARHQEGKSLHRSMGASSTMRARHQEGKSLHRIWLKGSEYSAEYQNAFHHQILSKVLNTMLHKLQAPGVELGDYAPHVYAEEGDTEIRYELDAITIPDISFDPDLDLDVKFRPLASVCMPSESTAYITQTSSAMEKHETVTLIQTESQKSNISALSHFQNMCNYIYDEDINPTL